MTDVFRGGIVPDHATKEDLDLRGLITLPYGDHLVAVGYYYQPRGGCWYCAVYEYLDDTHDCESFIGLIAASGVEFEDEGHAAAWGLGL